MASERVRTYGGFFIVFCHGPVVGATKLAAEGEVVSCVVRPDLAVLVFRIFGKICG